jgi:hypothetical protein
MGNFELVTPLLSGGIAHFFRDNDDPNLPWSGPVVFAKDQGLVGAVSLDQPPGRCRAGEYVGLTGRLFIAMSSISGNNSTNAPDSAVPFLSSWFLFSRCLDEKGCPCGGVREKSRGGGGS